MIITLKNNTMINECIICYINCTQCENGILPSVSSSHTEDESFVQIKPSENGQHFLLFPSNKITMFINLTNTMTTINPGGSIPIIIDDHYLLWFDGVYKFEITTDQKAFTINGEVQIKVVTTTITKCKICSSDNSCIDCKQGIIPSINSQFINATSTVFNIYLLPLETQPFIATYPLNGISITVKSCPRGQGINSQACASCVQCPYNQFMLIPSIEQCYSCNQNNMKYLNGIICQGNDSIMISYNYWVSALSTNNNKFHLLIDYTDGYEIYSSYCPSGFCCTSLGGCNYIESYDCYYNNEIKTCSHPGLCAFGRDPSSILCGKCEQGKSVLWGSTNCGICDKTNYSLIILAIIFIYMPFTIYIVYFESSPISNNQNNTIIKEMKMINAIFFDVFFYFYQSLSIILSSKGYSVSSWSVSLFSIINL
eukprot:351558_1